MPNSSFFFAQISLVTLVHALISFLLLSSIIYSVIYMSNKYLAFPLADSLTQFQGINTLCLTLTCIALSLSNYGHTAWLLEVNMADLSVS